MPASSGSYTGITCQNSTTHDTNDGGGDTTATVGNYCTTGNDPSGYTLTNLNADLRVAALSTLYLALYTDTTSGCTGSVPHCQNTLICDASLGPSIIVGTNSVLPTGCGTLAANTIYWINYQTGDGTDALGVNSTGPTDLPWRSGTTAGTWPSPFAADNADNVDDQLWMTGTNN